MGILLAEAGVELRTIVRMRERCGIRTLRGELDVAPRVVASVRRGGDDDTGPVPRSLVLRFLCARERNSWLTYDWLGQNTRSTFGRAYGGVHQTHTHIQSHTTRTNGTIVGRLCVCVVSWAPNGWMVVGGGVRGIWRMRVRGL